MPDILMTRIDNRLVHGQVGVAWTTALQGVNLIVVADDPAPRLLYTTEGAEEEGRVGLGGGPAILKKRKIHVWRGRRVETYQCDVG